MAVSLFWFPHNSPRFTTRRPIAHTRAGVLQATVLATLVQCGTCVNMPWLLLLQLRRLLPQQCFPCFTSAHLYQASWPLRPFRSLYQFWSKYVFMPISHFIFYKNCIECRCVEIKTEPRLKTWRNSYSITKSKFGEHIHTKYKETPQELPERCRLEKTFWYVLFVKQK